MVTTVGRLCSGDSRLVHRLGRGGSLSQRVFANILQWFSDHWPLDLDWPADIPRPDPVEDSPYIKALAEQAQSLNNSANDSDSAPDCTPEADLFALNEQGQIASPRALATSFYASHIQIGLDASALIDSMLDTYYQVVRQYADDKPRALQAPRAGTQAKRILDVLMAAGDARFAERIEREAERLAAQERVAERLGMR